MKSKYKKYTTSIPEFIDRFVDAEDMKWNSIHINNLFPKREYRFMEKDKFDLDQLLTDIYSTTVSARQEIEKRQLNFSLRMVIYLEEENETRIQRSIPKSWHETVNSLCRTQPEIFLYRYSLNRYFPPRSQQIFIQQINFLRTPRLYCEDFFTYYIEYGKYECPKEKTAMKYERCLSIDWVNKEKH